MRAKAKVRGEVSFIVKVGYSRKYRDSDGAEQSVDSVKTKMR